MRLWIARVVGLLVLATAVQAARPMKWESLMLVKAAAERGDHEAQFLLGVQYKAGDGLPRDRAEAAKWLRKAAESGHAEAQYALGELYADSAPEDGVADPAEAAKWLQAAAAQGQAGARERLAALLAQAPVATKTADPTQQPVKPDSITPAPATGGTSSQTPDKSRQMDEDPAETVRWSLLLSGLRGADALLVRGYMLESGVAMNRDLAAAAASYRKAAELGDARAQFRLGMMYVEGRGVTANSAEAAKWLDQAARQGSAEAAAELAKLRPGQIGEGNATAIPVRKEPDPARKP